MSHQDPLDLLRAPVGDDPEPDAPAEPPPYFRTKWRPSFDFVYFRMEDGEVVSDGGVILHGGNNEVWARCIAVGPGRPTPTGALRKPPCEPGDYFIINAAVQVDGKGKRIYPWTEFLDDDNQQTLVIGGDLIIASRPDKPRHLRDKAKGRIVDPSGNVVKVN